jgi:ATP-binding protein involved in chromosome partitioning
MKLKSITKNSAGNLTLIFENNFSAEITLQTLRKHCPCAECREIRGELNHSKPISTKVKKKGLKIIDSTLEQQIQLTKIWNIGNYAIGMHWADNHDSGIYTYQYLYSLCNPDVSELPSDLPSASRSE